MSKPLSIDHLTIDMRPEDCFIPKLDFGHSGGVAECVGDAFAEGWRKFCSVD